MGRRTLQIKPNGIIESGEFSYLYDDKGQIDWSCEVVAGFLIFNKTYKYGGTVRIDPKYLQSINFQAGTSMQLGALRLEINSVDAGVEATGTVSYQDPETKESGEIKFDLSGKTAHVSELHLNGVIHGQKIQIDAE